MTDEKKPPQGVVVDSEKNEVDGGSLLSKARLINALFQLDSAFGLATRAARAAGELALMQELETRWNDYAGLITRVKPPQLFK